jgi:hypothetical protein
MLISSDKKIILLFPPKTASTSISNAFLRSNIKFDTSNKILDYPILHLKLSEMCEWHDLENIDDLKILQFTRNPYYRFISAYYQLSRISSNNPNLSFYGMNFKEFIKHFDESKSSENFIKNFFGSEYYYYENIRLKTHWSGTRMFEEQVSYNDMNKQIHYFKIEDTLNNMSLVSELIGAQINITNNLNKNPVNIDYDILLDEECMKIIHRNFINDFEILGY